MLITDLIEETLTPASPKILSLKLLELMDELKVLHYPIVENNELMGIVSEDDVLSFEDIDGNVEKNVKIFKRAFVYDDQHIFKGVQVLSELRLTVLPVLDAEARYIGSVTLEKLIHGIAEEAGVNLPGSIVILELNANDYSLTEIAQIVEGNDAKILGTYVSKSYDSMKMEVTLKINQPDINGILQSFARYDYAIKASFQEANAERDLQNRYDELMNFLNI